MRVHKNFPYLFIGFLVAWLLLSASLSWQVVFIGVVVSFTLTALYASSRYAGLGSVNFSVPVIKAIFVYLFIFLRELIKSNFDVALRVVNPSLPIHPGIVEVKTNLKSPLGRLVLANSITLTPGTLTVETCDDSFFIHWIDVSSPDIETTTKEIVSTFEKYLEVIYG